MKYVCIYAQSVDVSYEAWVYIKEVIIQCLINLWCILGAKRPPPPPPPRGRIAPGRGRFASAKGQNAPFSYFKKNELLVII